MRRLSMLSLVLFLTEASFANVLFFGTGMDMLRRGQEWNKYFTRSVTQKTSVHDVGYFQGFVSGVASAARDEIDLPEGVKIDQICKIVYDYLQKNSNRLHEPAADLVVLALREGFPAQVQKQKDRK